MNTASSAADSASPRSAISDVPCDMPTHILGADPERFERRRNTVAGMIPNQEERRLASRVNYLNRQGIVC